MGFRTVLTYLALLPLNACTAGCQDYDDIEEFARAQLLVRLAILATVMRALL